MPEPNSLTARPQKGNSARLSYFFAFGIAVFIISGNPGVAAVFGLATVLCVIVTVKNTPPGGWPKDGEDAPPGPPR